jgi:hypothetical protein
MRVVQDAQMMIGETDISQIKFNPCDVKSLIEVAPTP